MEDQGWLKLYRRILQSDIFDNEKLLKVFIWCMCKATHTEHLQVVGRRSVLLKPGQFVSGRKKASLELSMPESTAWDYLKVLAKKGDISIKSDNKFSIITVENWGFYQSGFKIPDNKRTANGQQMDNKWTTDGQQMDTNKNDKKDNNEKNEEEGKEKRTELEPLIFPTPSCQKIYKLIGENGYRFFINADIKEDDNTISIKTKSNVDKTIIAQYVPRIDWQLNKRIEVS